VVAGKMASAELHLPLSIAATTANVTH
jgi:hypothetical protein